MSQNQTAEEPEEILSDLFWKITKAIDNNHIQVQQQITQLHQDLLRLENRITILENKI